MQQVISGQFRGGPTAITNLNQPLCVFDGIGTAGTSSWTVGGSVWDSVPVAIPLQQTWAVISWSMTFVGVAINPGSGAFGKQGRIEAALMTGARVQQPQTSPMVPFPPDAISKATLWDGQQDPMFPYVAASGAVPLIPLRTDTVLQVPPVLDPGIGLSIGLNITPSLIRVAGALSIAMICVLGVTWTITIDDGQQQRSGWGGP